ncbi:cache domain-containing protein [Geobacter sp. FeAm09]|uniref:cache domain-containing protein n=1 Tax=Geobacter sp. FeAm09 TaxID=2597769 RepID=UPI00143D2353|nr:cache domain-containing protein [Geobacter sp. FeAm09]
MNRNSVVTGIALGLAGFAVNWFKFELFFDVHLLFGSIVSMFAIMRFGLATGTIAALVASACTWYHWHHPWAIVTWTAEAFFAGLVAKRSRWSLLAGDFFYWISGGLLLGYLFNEYFIGASLRTVLLITLKQGINGIFNTLVATGLYIAFACENRGTRDLPTMFQTLFTSLAIFILVPVMGYFYFGINDSFHRRLRDYCADTAQICDIAEQDVALWLADRRYAVQALADLAGSVAHMEQPELQRIVETMHAAHPDFKRMVIVNKSSVTRACAPRLDEYGVSTIGIDLSTRSYNAILRSYSASRNPLSHPLLFDLFRGEAIGVKGPKLRIIAPVFVRGAYGGAASGVLNLASLQEVLQEIAGTSAMAITVVDQRGNVVVGTKTSLKPLTPYTPRREGRSSRSAWG